MVENSNGLRDALKVLQKSSPQAVEVELPIDYHNTLKSYLYIETKIERDFQNKIDMLQTEQIIFLCGSSGDGKSAILTRYSKKYSDKALFHLDATHSSAPHQNAITTLDQLFTKMSEQQLPLIIGINIGMMGNYIEGGADKHADIKASMRAHLNDQKTPPNHIYLNFESYPKFYFGENGPKSDFAKTLMRKLTTKENNPFWGLLEKDKNTNHDPMLFVNFSLLSMDSVQNVVIDALIKSRLVKDQFMTARSLLDFIYHLLTGPGYLFDNLYTGSDNELSLRIVLFDPSLLRTKRIDQFILQFKLCLVNGEFEEFKKDLCTYGISNLQDPSSYIRLFYLLRHTDFGNNFHHSFLDDFSDDLMNSYAKFWKLHTEYSGSIEEQSILRKDFYKKIMFSSLHQYMNRNATSQLKKNQYFIADYNGYQLSAELEIKADFSAIKTTNKTGYFNAYINVLGQPISAIPVNINLLELMLKLNEGYRPNKHDKNTIVILDEVVEKIIEIANQSNILHISKNTEVYEINNIDNDIFEVSGA